MNLMTTRIRNRISMTRDTRESIVAMVVIEERKKRTGNERRRNFGLKEYGNTESCND